MQTPKQNTKQSSTTVLPANQQQNVDLLMGEANRLYQTGGPQYYGGQTYAGPTEWELAGRESATGYATGAGQDYINTVRAGEEFWLDPAKIYNPSLIPGFSDRQGQITSNITRNLTENVLPHIRSGEIASGMFGGSGQGISEGLATEGTSRAIGEALTSMELGAYQQGQNMYNQAASRAPMIFDMGLRPADVMGQVGAAERADEQMGIDEAIQRFNFEEMAPYLNLQMLQGFTGNAGQYGGSTYGKGSQSQSDGGAGATQLIGTLITAIAMMYSNSTFKEDITPAEGVLAKLQSLPIFHWKYKGHGDYHIGPMAEDFRDIFQVGDGITLNPIDVLGVLLGAVKEIGERLERKGV